MDHCGEIFLKSNITCKVMCTYYLLKQIIISATKSLIPYDATAFGNVDVPQAPAFYFPCSRENISVLISSCCYNKPP